MDKVLTQKIPKSDKISISFDERHRRYYTNSDTGTTVYKKPCGKPRKDKEWCYSIGEWVSVGQGKTEKDVYFGSASSDTDTNNN